MEELNSIKIKPLEFFATSNIEAETVVFNWKIQNWSFLTRNEAFYSPRFNENEETFDAWKLQVKPYHWSNCYDFFSVYLERIQYGDHEDFKSTEAKANFQITLANEDPLRNHSREVTHNFKGSIGIGWTDFISMANLVREGSQFIKNDSIILQCKLTILGGIKHECWNGGDNEMSNQTKIEKLLKQEYVKNFSDLYENKTCADVTIKTNGLAIRVHKVILCARSPVFKSMFTSNMIEAENNEVNIDDFYEAAVIGMVEFMYKGDTDMLESIPQDLLQIANKYDMEGLRKISEFKAAQLIAADNVQELLAIAELHNASFLKNSVMNFLQRNRIKIPKVKLDPNESGTSESIQIIDISSP